MLSPQEMRKLIPFMDTVHYLDNASVVPSSTRVWAAMEEYGQKYPLNYGVGEFPASVEAAAKVNEARAKLAKFINAKPPKKSALPKTPRKPSIW